MNTFTSRFSAWRQIMRYGFVGAANNLAGYLIYLLITWLGVDPKIVITVLYPVGTLTAYFGHSRYSFSYRGWNTKAFMRYCVSYLVGYGVNFLMLSILSDKLGFPHQAVQALAVFIVAGIVFLMLKYFVFPRDESCNQ